ncbi:hypothetical protein [Lentibacillus sp. Marseille-P4043]|uniref:hypothetical protein n=1 Tax=Lentibacillus sp. Marseille-P4043 TaxID=2040293 RepID=UPI000D0B6EC6|nr:hypothetical protein [Lentibacillus sp. Marseille-P4043]
MTILAQKLSYSNEGIDKQAFVNSLQNMSDQLRWADQKLTMKVDNEIIQSFYYQQNTIRVAQSTVNRIKSRAKKPS